MSTNFPTEERDFTTTIDVGRPAEGRAEESTRLRAELCSEIALREQIDAELARARKELERYKSGLEQASNRRAGQELEDHTSFDSIVGRSAALRAALRRVEQVGATDATVLILGDTGTGKELIARAVHLASARSRRPLVKVNCAAIPSTLIESEFFGHEKGAFTGALATKVGRFELAEGGTIFLDEIGALPPELQAKLLRVLQEGEFERLGSTKTTKVDVRVVAATNRNLEHAMSAGEFRPDLYYRLRVFPIELPPLSARRDDIPLLVWFFIEKHSKRLGKRVDVVPEDVMDTLIGYRWPGNVRELENVVERAMIVSPTNTLNLDDAFTLRSPENESGSKRLEDVERAHIINILSGCGWMLKGPGNAAEQLDLNPSTLRSRMKKLGIRKPR